MLQDDDAPANQPQPVGPEAHYQQQFDNYEELDDKNAVTKRSFARTQTVRPATSSPKQRTNTSSQFPNATFLTECSFGVAHDRLVEVITDIQPFEPYWDSLSSVDLSGRKLDSVARLKEFLPRLDSLNL